MKRVSWDPDNIDKLIACTTEAEMLAAFPYCRCSSLRKQRYDFIRERRTSQDVPAVVPDVPAPPPEPEMLKSLRRYLKSPRTLTEICNRFELAPARAEKLLDSIRGDHVLLDEHNETITLASDIRKPSAIPILAEEFHRFGFVSDPHLGSKYERVDCLENLYDRFTAAGIEKVYMLGNGIDGEHEKINLYDLYAHGVEGQCQNFAAKYPSRPGIVTDFITGTCHEGWWIKRSNINIGKVMEATARECGRTDLNYIGHVEVNLELTQPGGSSILRLMHPGGGSSYAVSYSSQKYVETLQEGRKPAISVGGHFHKFDHCIPRGVHMFQCPSCQDQTPWMRTRRIRSELGGMILEIRQDESGIITSVKEEVFTFFNKEFYAHI